MNNNCHILWPTGTDICSFCSLRTSIITTLYHIQAHRWLLICSCLTPRLLILSFIHLQSHPPQPRPPLALRSPSRASVSCSILAHKATFLFSSTSWLSGGESHPSSSIWGTKFRQARRSQWRMGLSDTGHLLHRWLRGFGGKGSSRRTLLAFSIYLFQGVPSRDPD